MKNLFDLDKKLIPPNPRMEEKDIPYFKDVLIDCIYHSKPKNGSESIKFFKLGEKIYNSKDSVQLEDAEFEIVKEKVNENPTGYFSWVLGQVMIKILEWEKS